MALWISMQNQREGREAIAGLAGGSRGARVIEKAGYGKYFFHRTGHNIGQAMHGNGVNMDSLETRDDAPTDPRHLQLRGTGNLSAGIRHPQRSGRLH